MVRRSSKRNVFWSHQNISEKSCSPIALPIKRKDGLAFISNKDKIKSLVLNILFTEGERTKTREGTSVGNRGGHWSTSFSGISVGTLWDLSVAKTKEDEALLVKNTAQAALQRLVTYKVATDVKVDVNIHCNGLELIVRVYGVGRELNRILITKTPLENGWIWQ